MANGSFMLYKLLLTNVELDLNIKSIGINNHSGSAAMENLALWLQCGKPPADCATHTSKATKEYSSLPL